MKAKTPCEWLQSDEGSDAWETDCGHKFVLNEGTPEDNGLKYCCYCGKVLTYTVRYRGTKWRAAQSS